MVPLRNGIMVDAAHPQSGKVQTNRATVQGHLVHSAEVCPQRMLPASDGAAQGKSPRDLRCPPLPGR